MTLRDRVDMYNAGRLRCVPSCLWFYGLDKEYILYIHHTINLEILIKMK